MDLALIPFVTCQFNGQLGNQLFIAAATLGYAWEYQVTPFFHGLHSQKYHTSYNKNRIFFRLDASNPPRPITSLFSESKWYLYQKIPFAPDLVLFGYFQSWKYFHSYRDRILSLFAPSEAVLHHLNTKYRELIEMPNTVSVHIRTLSKGVHQALPFLGLDYFENAMKRFPSNARFIVFSDRINWCKNKFPKNAIFVEGNDAIEDLFLMSKCKHHIISNSTFSWWAAYMNTYPFKRIICPTYWGGYTIPDTLEDLYFPDWEQSPVTLAPYPEDMKLFDAVSQSEDDNY